MDFTDFTAGTNDGGRRVDRIIKQILKDNPQVNIYAALRKKLIKVNGGRASSDTRIQEGDVLSIASFLIPESKGDKEDTPPRILPEDFKTLFKNEHLWLINKAYGISVQPAKGEAADIASIIASAGVPDASLAFRPAPLHRLDKYTTGVLAISQSLSGATWFSKALQEHVIGKTYFGIAEGRLLHEELWEDDIAGKAAHTRASPQGFGHYLQWEFSFVRFTIGTGRKHQIREQSAIHGHPLLGDKLYGSTCPLPASRAYFLHAGELEAPADNPVGLPALIQAPFPMEFSDFIERYAHIR